MISKQFKHNALSDIQSKILKHEIDKIDTKTVTNSTNIQNNLNTIRTHNTNIIDIQKQLSELKTALGQIEEINYDDDIANLQNQLNSKATNTSVTKVSNDLKTLETDVTELEDEVDKLKKLLPKGAIMFFNLTSCPDGWSAITDMGGHYPRIATYKDGKLSDTINSTKEQMVHRHKHISPFMQVPKNEGVYGNLFRYGPTKSRYTKVNITGDTDGKFDYPAFSLLDDGTEAYLEGTQLLTGFDSTGDNNNWYAYTSDGMNRREIFRGYSDKVYSILTCPNKDENDKICKKTGNYIQYTSQNGSNMTMKFDNPHYDYMPLVGSENRPNSVVWLACQKK